MKIITLVFSTLITLFLLYSFKDSTTCNTSSFLAQAKANLEGATYLKSREIIVKSKKDIVKNNYYITLNKGTEYVFAVCDGNLPHPRLIMSIFDRNSKLVQHNFNEKENFCFDKITFLCNTTNVYYLSFSFMDGDAGCAAAAIGMNPKRK